MCTRVTDQTTLYHYFASRDDRAGQHVLTFQLVFQRVLAVMLPCVRTHVAGRSSDGGSGDGGGGGGGAVNGHHQPLRIELHQTEELRQTLKRTLHPATLLKLPMLKPADAGHSLSLIHI